MSSPIATNNRQVVIIGYGGHGYVAADIFLKSGIEVYGYCDNEAKEKNPFNIPYLGGEKAFVSSGESKSLQFFVSVGDKAIREKVFKMIVASNMQVANAIHPRAVVGGAVELRAGIMVAANAVINSACIIGDGVIINTSSSVDHECIIGDFTHICPGTVLCGNVTVGKRSFIGANSVVKPGVSICDDVVVGAGSTVIKNISEPGTYFGQPAKRYEKIKHV
jgi:sugar O-acyltransferase (sialic acid O-acetyltransferase NeuD family)